MKLFIAMFFGSCLPLFAAAPSFQQFDTNNFTVVNGVSIKVNTNVVATVGAVAAGDAARLNTNTIGSSINAITAGAVGDGSTDNSAVFTALFNSNANVYLPDGVFAFSTPIVVTNRLKLNGSEGGSVLKYTGVNTNFALRLQGQSNLVNGVVFDFAQTMSGTYTRSNGAVFLNPVGGSSLRFCEFRNINGLGVMVSGDSDILERSNVWDVSFNYFLKCKDGVHAAQTNRSEFGRIIGNTMWNYRGIAIFIGGANVVCSDNEMMGYLTATDLNGEQETGLWLEPSLTGVFPGRSHSIIKNNHSAHNGYDLMVMSCTGGGGTIEGNQFGGGHYCVISNTANMRIRNNLFNPNGSVNGMFMTNNTNLRFSDNQLSMDGGIAAFGGTTNGWVGTGNYFASIGEMDDYIIATRGALLGAITTKAITSVGNGTVTGTWTVSSVVQANYHYSTNGYGIINKWFLGNDINSDGNAYLYSWSGGGNDLRSLRVNSLTASNMVVIGQASPPSLTVFGGRLFSDGTNVCAVLQDAGGVKTTNRLSMTTYP